MKKIGFATIRAASSHGFADVVAVRGDSVVFVQSKTFAERFLVDDPGVIARRRFASWCFGTRPAPPLQIYRLFSNNQARGYRAALISLPLRKIVRMSQLAHLFARAANRVGTPIAPTLLNKQQFGNAVKACAALSFLIVFARAASAQVEWTVASGGNGHFYQPVSVPGGISWNNANAQAQAAGGYLTTVTSAAENAFVFSLIDSPQYWSGTNQLQGSYIGGFQLAGSQEPGSGFQWVTGEAWNFTAWNVGQPDNFSFAGFGNEDKVQYFGESNSRQPLWNDIAATRTDAVSYVIEFNAPVVVPEVGTLALLGFSLVPVGIGLVRRRK